MTLTKETSWKMFDEISPSYDRINRILSLGLDLYWRRQLLHYIPSDSPITLLDCASGTCDQLIPLLKKRANIQSASAMDLSSEMLKIGEKKLKKLGLLERCHLEVADLQKLPFEESTYDFVTISFGIRNIPDLSLALDEMYRVTKPNGKVLILEFSHPENPFLKNANHLYQKYMLPFLGKTLSGHKQAYRYLNTTIESFPYGNHFKEKMEQSGWKNIQIIAQTFGIVTLYLGEKS